MMNMDLPSPGWPRRIDTLPFGRYGSHSHSTFLARMSASLISFSSPILLLLSEQAKEKTGPVAGP